MLFDTTGISAISDLEAENIENKETTEEIPEAKIQLEILGHRYPAKSAFHGLGQLMSLIWGANGETFKAHEVCFLN